MSDKEQVDQTHRAPETPGENILANFKPQPAIPAVFVFMLTILIPALSAGPGTPSADDGSIFLLLIPVGIVVSCGLGIAAGFCSLFPPLIWVAIATWGLKLTQSGLLPGYNRWFLLAGIAVSVVMIIVQIWRVQTGRFQPTVRIELED